MRPPLRAVLAGCSVAVVAVSTMAAGPTEAAPSRAFVARARAFPVEPDPGINDTSFSMRPVAVELGLANPPVAAFGRATVFDAGFAENQFATEDFPPDDSFARCDTVSPNVPDEEHKEAGPVGLSASCDEAPAGAVEARGVTLAPFGLDGGMLTSRARGDGSGETVWVEAVSVAHDLVVGPLHVEELRFEARAEAGGEPGTAMARSAVEVVRAEVGGVPVTIGPDGVAVDETLVPAPLLRDASTAVQEAFSQSEYADFRIVRPEEEASGDGSTATVDGGAFKVFFQRSDDPADREYLGVTLLGPRVEVRVGAAVDQGGFDLLPATAGDPRVGGVVSTRPSARFPVARAAPASPARRPAVDASAAITPSPGSTASVVRRRVPAPSSAWMVAVVVGLAGAALALASRSGPLASARRRVEGWWDAVAEGFLRG